MLNKIILKEHLKVKSRSKKFQLYFKNYEFCEYVKFEAISWKIDIL